LHFRKRKNQGKFLPVLEEHIFSMGLNILHRSDAVQVVADEKFVQIYGMVGRAAIAVVAHRKVAFFQLNAFHKHANQPHLIIRIN